MMVIISLNPALVVSLISIAVFMARSLVMFSGKSANAKVPASSDFYSDIDDTLEARWSAVRKDQEANTTVSHS